MKCNSLFGTIIGLLMGLINMLMSLSLNGQIKGDNIWLGGYQKNYEAQGGQHMHIMNYNSYPLAVEYINGPMGILDNNASICNEKGQLEFYTNGRAIMNGHHEIIENGLDINAGVWVDRYWPTPTRGLPGKQDVLLLPDPKTKFGFYLIHKVPVYNPPAKDSFEIRYSYILKDSINGKGKVISKNSLLYNKRDCLFSYLTAIQHANKKDWWILQPLLGSKILIFLLNEQGIKLKEVQTFDQIFDKHRSSSSGSAKFSPDGSKYAIYNYYDQLHTYNFDRMAGNLSNHVKTNIIPEEKIDREQYIFGSVEWAPNGRFIYIASQEWLHQFDTQEPDPDKRIVLIDTYNGTLDPFVTSLFLMAQGPDCKIYMSPANGSYSLHVINKPNEAGKACNFVQNGIKLPNSNGGSLPNFPRFRVDEAEKCDPGISSLFGNDVYYRRHLALYPNPTHGLVQFKDFDYKSACQLHVTDTQGNILMIKDISSTNNLDAIDISHLASSRYNIEIYPLDNKERIFYGTQIVKL